MRTPTMGHADLRSHQRSVVLLTKSLCSLLSIGGAYIFAGHTSEHYCPIHYHKKQILRTEFLTRSLLATFCWLGYASNSDKKPIKRLYKLAAFVVYVDHPGDDYTLGCVLWNTDEYV